MSLSSELITKFFKFALVGLVSFFIDMGVTYWVKEKTRYGQYVANTCGFIVAVSFNFTMNRSWTFNSHDQNIQGQFMWYIASMLFGLLISNVLIYFLNEKGKINFYIAKLLATAVVMVWNFVVNNLWIFTR